MQNNERQAGNEVQQSNAADITMSSSHNAKPLVGCRYLSKDLFENYKLAQTAYIYAGFYY